MRTSDEVAEFKQSALQAYVYKCRLCKGSDSDCRCQRRFGIAVQAYEACIPRDFWDIRAKDVSHNVEVFKKTIRKYADNLNTALKKGYGLALLGDNGVGKTYFLSYVLMEAIRIGRTAYYTTMPQLVHNVKMGFKDPALAKRLEWMMTSDFVAIDEMGKERFAKTSVDTSFMDTQLERILKNRCDDSMPTLLASNMDVEKLFGTYGATISSIVTGKLKAVHLKSGDFRAKLASKMESDMGYGR